MKKIIKINIRDVLAGQTILHTEEQGKELYDTICYLLRNINDDETVELDFKNVEITNYIFLRYALAVFVHKYAREYLNQKLNIINIDDYWRKILKNEVEYQRQLMSVGYTYHDGKCLSKDKNFERE